MLKSPDGCLQFHTNISGNVKSFNYNGVGCFSNDHVCDPENLQSCEFVAGLLVLHKKTKIAQFYRVPKNFQKFPINWDLDLGHLVSMVFYRVHWTVKQLRLHNLYWSRIRVLWDGVLSRTGTGLILNDKQNWSLGELTGRRSKT